MGGWLGWRRGGWRPRFRSEGQGKERKLFYLTVMMESMSEIQKTNRMSPDHYCLSLHACPVWEKEEGRLGEILEDDLQLSDIRFRWFLLR